MSGRRLRNEIHDRLVSVGAFRVGVADPQVGFAQALDGCHPHDVMGNCRSVIVYAFNIGLDYYTAIDYEHNNIRIGHLYRDWAGLQLIMFLRNRGYDAIEVLREFVDPKQNIARMSYKLAAYEAGVGVFGKPSTIITLEYGPRANLGVVLTNAVLEPDGRMQGFDPCKNCNICVKACPVNAIQSDMPAPLGFDRKRCVGFVDWMKERTNQRVKLCGCCYDNCPAGKLVKKTLKVGRWTALVKMNSEDRRKLVDEWQRS